MKIINYRTDPSSDPSCFVGLNGRVGNSKRGHEQNDASAGGGYHDVEGGCDCECGEHEFAGGRGGGWGDSSGGGSGAAGGLPEAGGVCDGGGQADAGVSVAGDMGDPYARAGVAWRDAERGGFVGEMLSEIAGTGAGKWGATYCVSVYQYRNLRFSSRKGSPNCRGDRPRCPGGDF